LFQLADWLIYEPSQVRPYAEGKPLETVQVFNSKRTEAKGLSEKIMRARNTLDWSRSNNISC